jgi:Cu+-exporting ATPase
MATIDTIVFDKTGTLTTNEPEDVTFVGEPLSVTELSMVKSLVRHSTHPVSRRIDLEYDVETYPVTDFIEESGQGIAGIVHGHTLRLGRFVWVSQDSSLQKPQRHSIGTVTFLTIDGRMRGQFVMANRYREGLNDTITTLRDSHTLAVLSGDNDRERERLTALFGDSTELTFNQSPHDKLQWVQTDMQAGKRLLMVGDGLNDAGALKAATIGIAVSDNAINFTPACDGILEASQLNRLDRFLRLAKASRNLILASIVISIFYNLVGLTFAATGNLSPLISAILMPISSVSVILFSTIGTQLAARRLGVR